MGEIAGLMCYNEKGKFGTALTEAVLVAGAGMEGDVHFGGKRQLSVVTAEARELMDTQSVKGLCFNRFKENILLKGVDVAGLKRGSTVSIGCALLRVIEDGKRCFPECELFAAGVSCGLADGAFFAEVVRGGVVRVGDSAEVVQ